MHTWKTSKPFANNCTPTNSSSSETPGGMILGLAYAGTHPDAVRAVVTIGSGPITFEYLGVFSDNQYVRLGPCELEVRDFWKEPSREAADPDRASFQRLRAATVAYFYDRKKALHMAAELNPRH